MQSEVPGQVIGWDRGRPARNAPQARSSSHSTDAQLQPARGRRRVLTAFENVELPLLLTKLPKAARRRNVETALELVGLSDRLNHLPKQLSGGQEQRVAIARAIVTDPDLILADEPTGNLDARSGEEILNILSTLNRELHKTIVMVTHDPQAARHATHEKHLEKGIPVEGPVGVASASERFVSA